MDDTISRKAAIDAHCELCVDRDKCNGGICPDVEVFQLLPSAQPEQRWIPFNERLPEDGETVLVQFDDGKMDILMFPNIYKRLNRVAWMPLPEPYAERREE